MSESAKVSWRLFSESGFPVWQAGYRGIYVRAETKAGAARLLRDELVKAKIPLPKELDRAGP